jgi:hypothetical protein
MSWFKTTLISSITALFSISTAKPPVRLEGDEEDALEEIRSRMIAMAESGPAERDLGLVRRIRYASDIHALWFIRSELMAFLARSHGEAVARDRLERLGETFARVLPDGLRSRPSPLVSHRDDRLDSGPR